MAKIERIFVNKNEISLYFIFCFKRKFSRNKFNPKIQTRNISFFGVVTNNWS